MKEKIKIFVIADHPFSPSGVGVQTRYMIEPLLKTGKFSFICFGGAIKHKDYSPQKLDQWGDDLVIYPVDGYGTQEAVRSIIRTERPDMLWFMTDPRFFPWLWEIEDEIRSLIPMVYYHVWDNYPYPQFNNVWYESTDAIATISKVTSDIVQNVSPTVWERYIPHSVDTKVFKDLSKTDKQVKELKENNPYCKDKFICFWNNRNARRKQSGTLIYWFKDFLDQVGHDNATLVMHTDPNDTHGQDLIGMIEDLELNNGQVQFSTDKLPPEHLAVMYNMADVTINIADAEGFGLATLESLACETPVLVNMTGGLQEQVTDGEHWFGVGIEPASKAIIGSQNVPYIYEDRINKQDFLDALTKLYNMSDKEREDLGRAGRKHVLKNYNFDNYGQSWVDFMLEVHEKFGSWDTRKNYTPWEIVEI